MKKYFIILLGIMFMFVLALTSDFSEITSNRNEQIDIVIKDESEIDDVEINDGQLTIIVDTNEIIYTDTVTTIDTLTFEADTKLTNVVKLDNGYIAYGSKNSVPFMQAFQIDNNEFISTTSPYLSTSHTGEFTNVIQNDYYFTVDIEANDETTSLKFIKANGQLVPFYKEQIQYNYSKEHTIEPVYLVIHETANTAIGADANAHYRYWNTNQAAQASTHFVVDNTQVYQMLELNNFAWHVGDNDGHSDITNANSIGIEIAVNADGNYYDARQNAIDLTIKLMKSLNMDISQLKRHYDASGKNCPTNMLLNPELWDDFILQVEVGLAQ